MSGLALIPVLIGLAIASIGIFPTGLPRDIRCVMALPLINFIGFGALGMLGSLIHWIGTPWEMALGAGMFGESIGLYVLIVGGPIAWRIHRKGNRLTIDTLMLGIAWTTICTYPVFWLIRSIIS